MNESFERALAMRRGVLGDDYVDAAMGKASPFTAPFQEFATRWAWGEACWTTPSIRRCAAC